MKKPFEHFRATMLLSASFLLCCTGAMDMQAQTCEGRLCMKDGSRQLYTGNDRLEMPRKKRDVQVYRDFFSRKCQSDIVPFDRIDSIAVWNSAAPQNVRMLVPLKDVGWCWLYVSHPRMQVYVYASQGYSLNTMGGIKAWQTNTAAAMFFIPSKTACDFYVVQPGGQPVCLGDTYKKCDKAFVRKLCQCAGLTQEQEQELLSIGESNRSDMIQMVMGILEEEQQLKQIERKRNENNEDLATAFGSNNGGYGRTRTQE